MTLRLVSAIVLLVLAMAPTLSAQGVTGQIIGTLADASGAAVTGAVVKLTSDLSQQERSFVTDSSGAFTFTNLVPGDYTLRVAVPGFKTYEQRRITVSAEERVDLH